MMRVPSGHLCGALRATRQALGLTQAALAQRAGVACPTVIQVESGRGRLASLMAIAAALGVTIGCGRPLDDGETIGSVLATRRRDLGLPQSQAAARAGLLVRSLATIEADGDAVRCAAVERLAASLERPLGLFPAGPANYPISLSSQTNFDR